MCLEYIIMVHISLVYRYSTVCRVLGFGSWMSVYLPTVLVRDVMQSPLFVYLSVCFHCIVANCLPVNRVSQETN